MSSRFPGLFENTVAVHIDRFTTVYDAVSFEHQCHSCITEYNSLWFVNNAKNTIKSLFTIQLTTGGKN